MQLLDLLIKYDNFKGKSRKFEVQIDNFGL